MIVDLIFIGFVLLFGIIGIFKGFFSTLLSLVGFVGTLIIAFLLKDTVVELLNNWFGLTEWLSNLLGAGAGTVVAKIVAIIAVYIILRIVIFILDHTIGGLFKKGVVGKINAFLGFFLGLVQGAIYVLAIMVVFSFCSGIPSINDFTQAKIADTKVVKPVYEFVDEQVDNYMNPDIETPEEPAE